MLKLMISFIAIATESNETWERVAHYSMSIFHSWYFTMKFEIIFLFKSVRRPIEAQMSEIFQRSGHITQYPFKPRVLSKYGPEWGLSQATLKSQTVAIWSKICFQSLVQTRLMLSELNFQMGLKTLVGLVRGLSTKYGNHWNYDVEI